MNNIITFGSVCSGIEAAQLAFKKYNYKQVWCSENAEFPSNVLNHRFPETPNIGDMNDISSLILNKAIHAPDMLCGGTPCQAFSLAGLKNGLEDSRGQLTMKFIEIANNIDKIRLAEGKDNTIILWENVEGVLNDKTNAFGNFIAGLAGFDNELVVKKWKRSGYLSGPTRNVAWRVLDAKYFGVPQQRKRIYVLAGGKNFRPDEILFEELISHYTQPQQNTPTLTQGDFEIFRDYTDCLYAAYGTKWNGNAAAYNGSLYVVYKNRLRRFTPLECERLMGIDDNHTLINKHSDTTRYKAIGNSWAVPVIDFIGKNIIQPTIKNISYDISTIYPNNLNAELYMDMLNLNTSMIPNNVISSSIFDILEKEVDEKFYISKKAITGIYRRKTEMNINMNKRLEYFILKKLQDYDI